MSTSISRSDVVTELQAFEGRRGHTITSPDAVNLPMIRRWCAAMGDRNPVYLDEVAAKDSVQRGLIAPPPMMAVWTMPAFGTQLPADDAVAELYAACDRAGYTSIVATNSEQEYLRPLRIGDRISATKVIDSVSEEKQTALGHGVFITTIAEVTDGDGELVGRHLHRVLKYRPAAGSNGAAPSAPAVGETAPARRPRPVMTKDTAFYWEGAREHRLLIQRCLNCKTLRHPPTAACANCGSLEWDAVESAGKGTLFSYTVVHAPAVPPFEPPYVVALVALDEGTRLVSELVGVNPSDVRIGMRLECEWLDADPELTLPVFQPVREERGPVQVGDHLPPLRIPLTRSLIVATALATGDYQPLHHDPAAAHAGGMADVFMNIHTSNGLVGRYITDWGGPNATLRKIEFRLGAPNVAGDTFELTGTVVKADGEDVEVAVRGRNSRGDHVVGTVELAIAPPAGAQP